MRQDLFDRYIIERDQLKNAAKIPDKNTDFTTDMKIYELTPHRCGFLWIKKNEARKLKEREVGAEDRMELDTRISDIETLEEKIYGLPEPPEEKQPNNLSNGKREKALNKYIDCKRMLEEAYKAANEALPSEVFEQPEPLKEKKPTKLSKRKRKKLIKKYLKSKRTLEKILRAADETTPTEVFEQPEPPAAAPEYVHIEPPSATSTAAHGASDATHQSENQNENPTANVAKSPAAATTSEEPKPKSRAKLKKVAKPNDETPAPAEHTTPAPQLSGQIAMDELTNK